MGIVLIILIIYGSIWLFCEINGKQYKNQDKHTNSRIMLISICLLILLSGIVYGVFFEPWKTETTELTLVAMSNVSSINGLFFLGCGSFEGKSFIQYAYLPDNNINNRVAISKKYTSNSFIIQDDSIKPILRITRKYKYMDFDEMVPINEFYVPTGSIRPIYDIDVRR